MSESRERIVISALNLFLGGSFHKVGIAEVCSDAKVNKGTFYHFFRSKIEVLTEVVDRYAVECAASFAEVARSDADPRRKVMDLFSVPHSRNSDWKATHGVSPGCFIGNVILELSSTEPVVREHAQRAITLVTRTIQPVLADFLDAEKLDGIDAAYAAEILMSFIQGAQVQAKVRNDPEVFRHYARIAPDIIRGAGMAASA